MVIANPEIQTTNAKEQSLHELRSHLVEALAAREMAAKAAIHHNLADAHRISGLAAMIAHEAVEMIDPKRVMGKREVAVALMRDGNISAADSLFVVGVIRRLK